MELISSWRRNWKLAFGGIWFVEREWQSWLLFFSVDLTRSDLMNLWSLFLFSLTHSKLDDPGRLLISKIIDQWNDESPPYLRLTSLLHTAKLSWGDESFEIEDMECIAISLIDQVSSSLGKTVHKPFKSLSESEQQNYLSARLQHRSFPFSKDHPSDFLSFLHTSFFIVGRDTSGDTFYIRSFYSSLQRETRWESPRFLQSICEPYRSSTNVIFHFAIRNKVFFHPYSRNHLYPTPSALRIRHPLLRILSSS